MLRTRLIAGRVSGVVLSTVLATLLVVINVAETFFPTLRFTPGAPAPVTVRAPETTVVERDPHGQIVNTRRVTTIVARGVIPADPQTITLLTQHEDARRPPRLPALLGLWFVYLLVGMLLVTYLSGYGTGRSTLLRTQIGIFALLGIVMTFEKALLLFTDLSPLLIPVGAVPLWVVLFVERRAGVILSVASAFLAGSLVGFNLVTIAVFLAQGIIAAIAFRDMKHQRALLTAGAVACGGAAMTLVAARILFSGAFDAVSDMSDPWRSEFLSAALGGMLAGIVALTLSGIVERVLGAVSRARLLDLVDLEQPLLQKMAREAPGSWEHARAMANLAEVAAAAIRADALLTRTGAYYHDLGKTVQPKYFIENLLPGERSPHEELEPDVSADAIMAHVVMGTKILRDGGVPEPVVEFAYTHHGTSVIEFFWDKCQKAGNPKALTEDHFRYPGMRPRNKETAILMLVDAIEAASRTIQPPRRDKFEEMVRRVVFSKLSQGQLDDSGITMEDLRVMTQRLVDTLVRVFHNRIAYPWQQQQQQGTAPTPVDSTSNVPPQLRATGTVDAETVAAARDDRSSGIFPPGTLESGTATREAAVPSAEGGDSGLPRITKTSADEENEPR
ncbi:MAG: HDIG domain-containing protein [Deltaproteobacteria bacterium]|nr:HDIG domain-containing protein [Deltaproteobacteria bacterium]